MRQKSRCFTILLLSLSLAAFDAAVTFASDDARGQTFTNPIISHGADPWVIRWDSAYYYCFSTHGSIWVNVATNLEAIGAGDPNLVWSPPRGTRYSRELWAPELHFLQGNWYIYLAADDGNNSNHRMYVLEGTTMDPTKPFILKGKIASTDDHWAIDGTVLEMPDRELYFIWSGWAGTNNVAQNLYIAPMSNPWTIVGSRVCISQPEFPWEMHGLPVNEGPETLWHDGRAFIIYSASGMWTDDYCLGELAWNGGNVLDAGSWIKTPKPVFDGTAAVFGPGHCSFVHSPDGKEDWLVYHAHVSRGSGARRNVRIQQFTWNADGSPNFGTPVAAGVPLPRPSGEN